MKEQAKELRLDKYLADMGVGTRSEVKQLVRKGQVLVNGEVCKKAEMKVKPGQDDIVANGQSIRYKAYEYYMLNKPSGVVSAVKDNLYPTVTELIKEKIHEDLFPVGRLDVDTEGLLLLTNDGPLAHLLLSPKKHVDKVYYAKVAGDLPADCVELFKTGVTLLDGTKVLPADLVIISNSRNHQSAVWEVELTIHEGKFHQVKRMFEAVGGQVTYLKRISMGSLKLDETLALGQYRELTEAEVTNLKGQG